MASLPPDVRAALATYLEHLRGTVGDSLVGLYVTGSAATSDFNPVGSDIDAFVILREPPSADLLDGLRLVHNVMKTDAPYGDRLDVEYVAAEQLRPTGIIGHTASISAGRELRVTPSRAAADDILGARMLGISLFGPPQEQIFPPVDRHVFVASQRKWLEDLAVRDQSRPNASDSDYASRTLNIARCLFGIHHGRGCTKFEAANWLSQQLPELAPTLEAALRTRGGDAAAMIGRRGFRRFADTARTLVSAKDA